VPSISREGAALTNAATTATGKQKKHAPVHILMSEGLLPPLRRVVLRDAVAVSGVQSAGEQSFELSEHV